MLGLDPIGKLLSLCGGLLPFVGGIFIFMGKAPALGRLSGETNVSRGDATIYWSLVGMVLVSLALTLVLNVVVRLFR